MQKEEENNIFAFKNAILKSITEKNWYSALTVALIIPDICGNIEYPNESSSKRYIKWYDTYLKEKYKNFLSGKDCYALRCSLLHEGSDEITHHKIQEAIKNFIFVKPDSCFHFHNNKLNNSLQLQVDIFCKDMCEGFDNWAKNIKCYKKFPLLKIHDIRDGIPGIITFKK